MCSSDLSTGLIIFLAFVVCSVMASIAGFYSAAQVQIGSPIVGDYALTSIAAAVLGGASLAGGRGSFVGTLLAALFLSEINNVLPLFDQPALRLRELEPETKLPKMPLGEHVIHDYRSLGLSLKARHPIHILREAFR